MDKFRKLALFDVRSCSRTLQLFARQSPSESKEHEKHTTVWDTSPSELFLKFRFLDVRFLALCKRSDRVVTRL
jgi:hypothetical protein